MWVGENGRVLCFFLAKIWFFWRFKSLIKRLNILPKRYQKPDNNINKPDNSLLLAKGFKKDIKMISITIDRSPFCML